MCLCFLSSVKGGSEKKSDKVKKKKKMMKLTLKLKVKAKEKEEEKDEKKKSSLKFTISKSRLSSPASSTLTTENSGDQRDKFISVVSNFPEIMKLQVVVLFPILVFRCYRNMIVVQRNLNSETVVYN